MSRPVTFRRIQQWDLRLGDRPDVFQVELQFEKTVDSGSGMTLNLVEVDELLGQLRALVLTKNLHVIDELVMTSENFLQSELARLGAHLVSFECRALPAGDGVIWRRGESLSRRTEFLARVEVAHRFRTGPVRVLLPVTESCDFPQVWEAKMSVDEEIIEKLGRDFPRALEIEFQDLQTGDSWRRVV